MRAFTWFFGLILAGLAAMALLAYPAWELLQPSFNFPFHRVASRIGMLSLAIGFFLVARRLRLADKTSLGYGVPRPVFLRELLVGFVLGVVLMLPIILAMIGLDLRQMKPGVTLDAATLTGLALEGITRGLVVAFIEETFLRGAMFSGIARESGPRVAIILTALVYSTTHFIGRYRIPAEEVTWSSGLDLLAGTFHAFSHPLVIADAFLCLFAVGVLLGMVRTLTGNVAACVGLHAGWVWMITFMRETSGPNEASPYRFLQSRFDGFVGWMVLAWIVVIGFALYRFYAQRGAVMARQTG